jgi:hypothetical protein
METVTLDRHISRPASKKLAQRSKAGWLFKACARCGGDVVLESDEFGDEDYTCIQCGATHPRGGVIDLEALS